ncbi:ATP-dependent helicase HrpB [Cecembia rubra]|uniref:ATP-dependent helicase HrpB n=1 Tax=Cecembia rubra TaxID=1485585 RepID=A0A2P8EDF6_9BACT|nr:ATP-dependent helicase HrpB [Cecembia rubra]PSL07522.1 ATP-dependent helicase HrpB [Cecembia rubra]
MSFPYQNINLPIVQVIPEILSLLSQENTVIVNAPPGAGKSTILPITLLEEDFLQGKKILILEPRRLAAKSIAYRMAELLGEEVGQTVGYRIRFESIVSSATRLEVLTEGILTRMMQQDNALEDVGLVIFDEFHERNIHADLAMALCREVQQVLRPDLRILVMSATLDLPQLAELLKASIVKSEGKAFPVEIQYTGDYDQYFLSEQVASIVLKAAIAHKGDILVFLPGQAEIKKTEAILRKKLPDFSIHPLYGQLSPLAQKQAILPNRSGKRKVVLSTSIAETSLTIEGVSIAVDSGLGKTSKFNPRSGLSKLETIRISKDSADQRAGRAGRLGPGFCYRMWSKATHQGLDEFRTPEILEADLSFLVLDLLKWGIKDVKKLTWLSPPPQGAVMQALDLLEKIDAIKDGKITAHGIRIHQIPAHPRIAHMLLMAEANGKIGLGTDLAALMEERDPLEPTSGVDINLRIEALRRARKENLSIKGLNKIEKVAKQYRKVFRIEPDNSSIDPYETGLLIAYAYPERIAHARPGNNARFQLSNGKMAMMDHKDELAHEPWLAVSHIDARDDLGKIFLASPLNPKDLKSMVKEKRQVVWEMKKGGLIAQKYLAIGGIILRSEPLTDLTLEEKNNALLKAVKADGLHLLDFSDSVLQLIYRVSSLRIWNPDQSWPDWSPELLIQKPQDWLLPYLSEIKKNEDFKKLDLSSILLHSLDYSLQNSLEFLAPEKIKVPSGSQIKIQYRNDGDVPILAVRLQEVFGLLDTPKVNGGKTPLLMHLLSPGYKPVQVTSDLRSFWDKTYHEVKKELKRRYPKHYWPEDPFKAEAVRGVKRE